MRERARDRERDIERGRMRDLEGGFTKVKLAVNSESDGLTCILQRCQSATPLAVHWLEVGLHKKLALIGLAI